MIYKIIFVLFVQSSTIISPLPASTRSLIDLSRQKYFIDKTLLLHELFNGYGYNHIYITAPKGFGKTTILNMINLFSKIELNSTNQRKHYKHTGAYEFFKKLKISRHKKTIEKHLARYPTLYLNLTIDIPVNQEITENYLFKGVVNEIKRCYQEYKWLLPVIERNGIPHLGKMKIKSIIAYMEKALKGQLLYTEATRSLLELSSLLHIHYRKPVIVLIDNYDFLVERVVHKGNLVELTYSLIDGMLKEIFEKGIEHVYLGLVFCDSGLPLGKTDIFEGDSDEIRYMHRFAFLENHIFTPYLGLTEIDLMILNRRYRSAKTEIELIKRNYNGYVTLTNFSMYNLFSVSTYFMNKKNSNFSQTRHLSERPHFDEFGSVDYFIKNNAIRDKIIQLIICDRLNTNIKKMYDKKIYLYQLFESNSKTSISQKTQQMITFLFEKGYMSYTLDHNYISIANLEHKEYLLKRLQVDYEISKINVQKSCDVLEEMLHHEGDNVTELEMKLKRQLHWEFNKLKEVVLTSKDLEYQAIVYIIAYNSKHRTNEVIGNSTVNEQVRVLLSDSENDRAMIVDIKKEGRVDKDSEKVVYVVPNITCIKYLTIYVHKSSPIVILR